MLLLFMYLVVSFVQFSADFADQCFELINVGVVTCETYDEGSLSEDDAYVVGEVVVFTGFVSYGNAFSKHAADFVIDLLEEQGVFDFLGYFLVNVTAVVDLFQ